MLSFISAFPVRFVTSRLLAAAFGCAAAGWTLAPAAEFQPIFVSTFTAAEGTPLSRVGNQPAALRWRSDVAGLTTTGNGALRVRADGSVEGAKAMSFIPLGQLVKPNDRLWLIVEIAGWKLTGPRDEQLRVSLMHSDKGDNPSPLAQLRLSRNSKGLHVAGEAFNAQQGATHVAPQLVGGAEGSERLILALEYIPTENRYTLYRHTGGENFEPLGSGMTSAQRRANFLRIHARGDFASSEGEFIDIERVLLMRVK